MKSKFKRFGDVITFDITYNILRRRTIDNRQWGLGIISGFGSNLEPVVFGFCLVSRETKEAFVRLFKNIFEMLDGSPNSIITDEQLTIKQALTQLRFDSIFKGNHYNDGYHILKNLKRKTTKKALIYYQSLLKARNEAEYQEVLLKLL